MPVLYFVVRAYNSSGIECLHPWKCCDDGSAFPPQSWATSTVISGRISPSSGPQLVNGSRRSQTRITRRMQSSNGAQAETCQCRATTTATAKSDLAAYRPSTGYWYLLKSSTNFSGWAGYQWGSGGDVPVPGDYDGDGKCDPAIFRPSTGFFYFLKSSTNFASWRGIQWGTYEDLPAPGDYDGDGITDLAVFRPSTASWYLLKSTANFARSWSSYQWGSGGDLPAPGDYDGDGKTDIAVYRPSNGSWYLLKIDANS